MSEIQISNFSQMKSFIERNEWPCSEKMEGYLAPHRVLIVHVWL